MKERRRKGVVVGLLVGVLAMVSGCSLLGNDESEPVFEELVWEPGPEADLVCGMSPAAVETALGLPVGAVEGGVTGESGDLQGTCEIWPGAASTFDGPMLSVRVVPSTSEEGLRRGSEVTGDVPGVREPDVRYKVAEGAVWFSPIETDDGRTILGGSSVVVVDDYVVALTSRRNDPERDAAEDLLALSQQVAASYGLAEDHE